MKTQLVNKIKTAIERQADQVLSFSDFMQMILYDPDEGYYNQSVSIGHQGDFVTSPELGPLFAYALAQQFIEVKKELGSAADILEFGAGTGQLAYDVLNYLEKADCLPEHYYILEVSGYLKSVQSACLKQLQPALYERIVWCDAMPTLEGMVIANEVLDAMPVHKVRHQRGQWQSMGVAFSEEAGFHWQTQATLPKQLEAACAEVTPYLAKVPEDYETEINLNVKPWLNSLADSLTRGVVLLIDYGFPRHEYYHPSRAQGTLMCHQDQQTHTDVFANLGQQDVTAHVDFTAVAEAAVETGFEVDGYTDQANFLLSLGVLSQANDYSNKQALKLLTLPHEMGELFKVIGLSRDISKLWRGFKMSDKRGRL